MGLEHLGGYNHRDNDQQAASREPRCSRKSKTLLKPISSSEPNPYGFQMGC
jgi:hypothetical protein